MDDEARAAPSPTGTLGGKLREPVVRWVQLLRTTDLSHVARLPRPLRHTVDLSFSPNGRFLAGAAADGGVQLWDLESLRRELATMDLDWQP